MWIFLIFLIIKPLQFENFKLSSKNLQIKLVVFILSGFK